MRKQKTIVVIIITYIIKIKNKNKSNASLQILPISFPKINDKIAHGQIIKFIKVGIFLDIGIENNAFLHISQIKCPKEILVHYVKDFNAKCKEKKKQVSFQNIDVDDKNINKLTDKNKIKKQEKK